MSNHTAFTRTGFLSLVVTSVDDCYGNISSKLNLPPGLLQEPMRLMPMSEMVRYILELEKLVDDELFSVRAGSKINLKYYPSFESVVGSARDLFTAMLRFNNLFTIFQSGTTVGGRVSGKMLKWRYNIPSIEG